MPERGRALVLGDDGRSCLTVVRSLGRHGIDVLLGTESADSIVPRSRYVARAIRLPPTESHVDEWVAELRSLLRREVVELVVPCADEAVVPLATNRSEFEQLARLAIPDEPGFELSYRKDRTVALARELDVPVPTTVLVNRPEDLEAVRAHESLSFPLVVKPVSSKVWKAGRRTDLRVSRVHEEQELEQVAGGLLHTVPVLIQSHFEGVGVGQEFLANEGTILDAFQHQRVHEPLAGGGSSYRKSAPLDERMLECSRRLLAHARWTGVAMVEYRVDPRTGSFVLMEINGRFWGSLPLAVAAGVDFPYRLYELMVHGRPGSPTAYRTGLYARNPIRDLGWLRERAAGPAALSAVVNAIGSGLAHILLGRERWDTITFDDPVPGLVEMRQYLASLVRRLTRRTGIALLSARASTGSWRRRQRQRLLRLLRSGRTVLFVCRGNICRSPFAESYATQRSKSLGLTDIEWTSAGTYPVARRESPESARAVGREFGIMLDEHRSRILDRALIDGAAAVVCMDSLEYGTLRREYPDAKRKLLFLKAFDTDPQGFEIADPWGKPAEEFRICYRQVASSVDGLIRALGEQ